MKSLTFSRLIFKEVGDLNMPKLLHLQTIEDYRKYYAQKYCKKPIITFDGIPVYFSKSKFDHAFFESSRRDKNKDQFSLTRAKRIDWIEATLTNPKANLYQGWDKKRKRYDPRWRVNVIYEDYVVVLQIRIKKSGFLKAEFRTAYVADNSIDKIRKFPEWKKELLI